MTEFGAQPLIVRLIPTMLMGALTVLTGFLKFRVTLYNRGVLSNSVRLYPVPDEIMSWSTVDNVEWVRKSDKIKKQFLIIPARCFESGRLMWLRYGYNVMRWEIDYDMEYYTESRWYSDKALMMLRLKA